MDPRLQISATTTAKAYPRKGQGNYELLITNQRQNDIFCSCHVERGTESAESRHLPLSFTADSSAKLRFSQEDMKEL